MLFCDIYVSLYLITLCHLYPQLADQVNRLYGEALKKQYPWVIYGRLQYLKFITNSCLHVYVSYLHRVLFCSAYTFSTRRCTRMLKGTCIKWLSHSFKNKNNPCMQNKCCSLCSEVSCFCVTFMRQRQSHVTFCCYWITLIWQNKCYQIMLCIKAQGGCCHYWHYSVLVQCNFSTLRR